MTRPLALLAAFVVVTALGVFAYASLTDGHSVSTHDVVAAIARGDTVVDVRTPGEYAAGHIEGALHADILDDQFEQRISSLDRTAPVYLYCGSGVRSGRAARRLEGMGFQYVVNAGGFEALVEAGAPVAR